MSDAESGLLCGKLNGQPLTWPVGPGNVDLRTDPVSASVMRAPISGEHRCDTHDLTGRRSVDLQAVADVDADMRNARLIGVGEKDEVPGLRVGDGGSRVELIYRDARQMDSHRGVHVLDETTAVDPSMRAAAKQVGHT